MIKQRSLVSALVGMLLFTGVALPDMSSAAPIFAEQRSATLLDLFSGQHIIVGDKVFANWKLKQAPSGFDPSGISVVGLNDLPLEPGLEFRLGEELLTGFRDFNDKELQISFDIAILGKPRLKIDGFSQEITDFILPSSDTAYFILSSSATILRDGLPTDDKTSAILHNRPPPPFELFDREFIDPVRRASFIVEFSTESGFNIRLLTAGLQTVEMRIHQQIPEPGTLTLFVIGALGLSIYGRRWSPCARR